MRANRPRDKLSQKERIREITEKLEEGVKAVFKSDRYKEYSIHFHPIYLLIV